MERIYPYHASIPYAIETREEALEDLQRIVGRLQHLYEANQFQQYDFGTLYAYDAGIATRDLMAWQKRKFDIPLDTKLQLTRIYTDACFDAVEPNLMVRYGMACLSLWKSFASKNELRELHNVIDWKRLIRVVRNVVILPSIRNNGTGTSNNHLGGGMVSSSSVSGIYQTGMKQSNMFGVALSIATLFRSTVILDNDILNALNDDILSFLGPHGHEPAPHIVIEAYAALIPYRSPNSVNVFMPILFDLSLKVTPNITSLCILPAIAEFSEQVTRDNVDFKLSDSQLDFCFQTVLHSLRIPLASTQKATSGGSNNRSSNSSSDGGEKNSGNNVSSINIRSFGTHSSAFAKLIAWSLSPGDTRALDLLDSLVNAVLSFCHPSNIGPWTALIFSSLMEVTVAYVRRLNQEEELKVVESRRLTKEITERMVGILRHPVLMGCHSQAPYVFASSLDILRNIAMLSPEGIIPHLLGEIYPTIQHGLHQRHRLLTSLACLSRIAVPMANTAQLKMHLTTLLELSLPSIDANESKRCLLALALFQTAASVVVFKDESDDSSVSLAAQCLPECVHSLEENSSLPAEIMSDNDLATQISQGTTAAYPEILSLYIKRCFELVETTSEARLGSAASASVLRVLLACSPPIFERLLQITLQEILNPQQLSHDSFAQMCGCFVRANCSVSFKPMWDLLSQSIREEITENQAGSGRTVMPKDNSLLRYLSVLNMSLLAANSESICAIADDIRDLLRLLREKTNVSVIYTVANTLHHAIAALTGYSIILPNPLDESPEASKQLSLVSVPYHNYKWNVPTERSRQLAVTLFTEHTDISEAAIEESIGRVSTNVADEDAVSNALIFIRTATGAISVLVGGSFNDLIENYRQKIMDMITDTYQKLSRDDVSSLKEVLFVAKVCLCDVGYERTSRIDSHQETLYQYEKRAFKIPGAHKNGLPPAVLARRAQLFHHQQLALKTQFRNPTIEDKKLLLDVIVDACFSAYPAVRRNAFSALYSPLKIFSSPDFYGEVYSQILDTIDELLKSKEYERALGGFSLLKYRSLGIQTVGRFPELLLKLVKLISNATSTDHRQLCNAATATYFMLIPDVFRVGERITEPIAELSSYFSSEPFSKLHWREALFRTTALIAFSQCPGFPIQGVALKLLLEGSRVQHPDLRTTSMLGALNMMQKAFRLGYVGPRWDGLKTDSEVEVPIDAVQSNDDSLIENDFSLFFAPAPVAVSKSCKTQPRPSAKHIQAGSQGWDFYPKAKGLWRAPSLSSIKEGLPLLSSKDETELCIALGAINTSEYWCQLFELHEVEPRVEDDKLCRLLALLYRNLVSFASLGYCGPKESLATLLEFKEVANISKMSDKNWHRVSAAFFCGLMLSLPSLTPEHNNLVMTKILQITEWALSSVSPETISFWNSALSFALSNIDHRRLLPLIHLLERSAKPNTSSDGGGFKLSLRMELYTEVLAAVQWHYPRLLETIENWPHWNHGLQTTRESCGDETGVAALTCKTIDEPKLKALSNLFDLQLPKIEMSLLHLMLRLLQLVGGDACLELLTSKAFSFLLKCSSIRDDPEIVVLVTKVFTELSVCTFNISSLESLAHLVISSTQSAQWHQRIRMLLFLQSFFFNHLLTLTAQMRNTLAMVAVDALSDPQAEVRELAADTLSGMVRCSPVEEQKAYVKYLTTKLRNSVGKNTTLIERHAAVLGLGALIGAFPYTSPPPSWIPGLLATLAVKAASDNGIVGKSAKQILGDFKKTRQDTWHIDQASFSQDQLDDLDGVLWKNYFA